MQLNVASTVYTEHSKLKMENKRFRQNTFKSQLQAIWPHHSYKRSENMKI